MSEVYAFRNNMNEVMKSSSGGAYIAICQIIEEIYGQGNVSFYGVCFNKDMKVIHSRVDNSKNCNIFQGSKYVKSDFVIVLELIKKDLKENKYVVFSGTPCQVFAINSLVEKNGFDKSKIFTIDIICHGTPSAKIWDNYKNWLEKKVGSKLIKYSFRYKPEGWKAYPAYAEFENDKKMINTAETSVFSKLHMYGYSVTSTCFSCKFSNMKRNGDITLGDFWGIENIEKSMYEKNGVSLVLVNSIKAKKIIEKLSRIEKFKIKKIEGNNFLQYQHNLNQSTRAPEKYKEFADDYEKYGFEFILKKYLNYGTKYKVIFYIKKYIRKTPLISIIRRFK